MLKRPGSAPGASEENRLTEIDWIIQMSVGAEIFGAEARGFVDEVDCLDFVDGMDAPDHFAHAAAFPKRIPHGR